MVKLEGIFFVNDLIWLKILWFPGFHLRDKPEILYAVTAKVMALRLSLFF